MKTAGHTRRLLLLYRIFARRAGLWLLPRLARFAFLRRVLGRRVPVTVMIAVTCRCQCDCAHCSASALTDGGAELSAAEVKGIIADAAALGAPKIGFTGGEPLLRADLAELTACAAGLGLSVSIDTNGLLLDEKKALELKAAGICNINISLDSPEARRHDRLVLQRPGRGRVPGPGRCRPARSGRGRTRDPNRARSRRSRAGSPPRPTRLGGPDRRGGGTGWNA